MSNIIVVHIESGQGNQMLSYCEYLAIKKANPEAKVYIETIIYDLSECNDVINQWNGYELSSVFNIKAPNIKELFSEDQWVQIIREIKHSRFWENYWNYPPVFVEAFRNAGLDLINIRGNFAIHRTGSWKARIRTSITLFRRHFIKTRLGDWFKRWIFAYISDGNKPVHTINNKLFLETQDNIFTGQQLSFKLRGHNIERIHDEICTAFQFSPFRDRRNIEMAKILDQCNAVAIHARRGDMLNVNGYCYKYGYFKRAVKYIRLYVENPVFVFFTDPGSVEWCRENTAIFGLNTDRDIVQFVDWNEGRESYRDMQLMALCKHAIITNSTFGWWGTYFISNPHKITISPIQEIDINTTNHC